MYLKAIACVVCMFLSSLTSAQNSDNLKVIHSWKTIEYGFPSAQLRQEALESGLYVKNAGTLIDVGVQYPRNGTTKVFVTIPRFTKGIPYSLARVSTRHTENGPVINAYPTYSLHNIYNGSCLGIISAFRVAVDECGKLWVIDSGVIEDTQICPPQLLVFDLDTNTLKHRFQLPRSVYTPGRSLLVNLVVDVRDPPPWGSCQHPMVYIADVDNHGLIVFNPFVTNFGVWRIENEHMYPDPEWGNQTIAGQSFVLMDGIIALNVSPKRFSRHSSRAAERFLYFHALASDAEVRVPLRILNNRVDWTFNSSAMQNEFKVIGRRGIQSALEAMDSEGNLFANTHYSDLFVWNIRTPYTKENFKIVSNDKQKLQFASGMKVVRNNHGAEELWVATNRYQKVATGTQNPNEINYRIVMAETTDLLKNNITKTTTTSSWLDML